MTSPIDETTKGEDEYMKIRRELFDERVWKLRLCKWQIPYKSNPNIKGLSTFFGYPEEVVEEFIMRLELAAGLKEMTEKLPKTTKKVTNE